MNPAEAQIIEQFRRLDPTSQRRVLDALHEEIKPFDIAAWKQSLAEIRADMPDDLTVKEMLGYLDDVRGESTEAAE